MSYQAINSNAVTREKFFSALQREPLSLADVFCLQGTYQAVPRSKSWRKKGPGRTHEWRTKAYCKFLRSSDIEEHILTNLTAKPERSLKKLVRRLSTKRYL